MGWGGMGEGKNMTKRYIKVWQQSALSSVTRSFAVSHAVYASNSQFQPHATFFFFLLYVWLWIFQGDVIPHYG